MGCRTWLALAVRTGSTSGSSWGSGLASAAFARASSTSGVERGNARARPAAAWARSGESLRRWSSGERLRGAGTSSLPRSAASTSGCASGCVHRGRGAPRRECRRRTRPLRGRLAARDRPRQPSRGGGLRHRLGMIGCHDARGDQRVRLFLHQVDRVEPVRAMADGYHVLAYNEVVPYSEAKPSRDGMFWRCQRPDGSRRCFFAPPPST